MYYLQEIKLVGDDEAEVSPLCETIGKMAGATKKKLYML